jgi:type IV pilus assembly protein PilW
MYAIYGVSTTASGPGVFGEWVSPGDVGTYDISTVMNSANSEPLMKSIVAVRVSLIVRGEYYDKNIVSPSSLSVFSGLTDGISSASLTKTVNLTPTQQHYRYRTFEFTVPLRNMLILAGTS